MVAFGTHLGGIWEVKIDPRWSKLGSRRLLKRYFVKNMNFHETSAGVVSGAFPGPQDSTQNDPRSSQDGPKTILFRFFFRFVFCIDFWSLFGAILVPFRGALGRLLGAQIGHFWHRFFVDVCMSFQERPKSGQEPPKSGQERPKSAPGAPKSGPRAPKSGPRAPKSGPRAAQSGPRAAKSDVRAVKMLIFDAFRKFA